MEPVPSGPPADAVASLSGKKVLLVITKSNWGGAQAYTYAVAEAIRDAGGEVAVVLGGTGEAGAATGLLSEKLTASGIRTIFLDSFARDISLAREPRAFASLVRIMRAEKPDVVHLNSSKAGGLGALAARIAGVPRIVFTAHGWAHREPRSALARSLITLASWITVVLCHSVIVVSRLDYDDAPASFLRHKLRLIPNGMDPFPMLTREEARAALGERAAADLKAPWIVAVSELHPNKGLDVLIRAFASIDPARAPSSEGARLLLLGEGQERARLTDLIQSSGLESRAHLLGFVANARQYLAAADIYALPSRKEGMPLAVLEAGLAQLPVVASRVGGVPEIIMSGVTGLLVPSDDASALASALETLLKDSALREKLAEHLHHRVLRDFSQEQMIEKTFAVYDEPAR